jgi:hypothetical protein
MSVWRAPEAQMPPELVAAMRRYAPEITFPAAEPASAANTAAPDPAALHPLSLDLALPANTPRPGEPPADEASHRTGNSGTPSAEHTIWPDPSISSVSPCLRGETAGSPGLDWLMATLRAAMEGVMAGDAAPLPKANAVARLAGLYLKAYGAAELERENRALTRRLAAAEARAAAREERPPAGPSEPAPAPDDNGPEAGHPPAVPARAEGNARRWVPEEQTIAPEPGGSRAARAAPAEPVPLAPVGTDGARDPP